MLDEVLTTESPRWDEFVAKLDRALRRSGCDGDESAGPNPDHYRHAKSMRRMRNIDIPASIDFFERHGGFCDCEVVLNVDALRGVCLDCNANTYDIDEYYMVNDNVWQAAHGGRGMLCIGCFEKRIGRKLTRSDFKDVPVNDSAEFGYKSARLRDRLALVTRDHQPAELPRASNRLIGPQECFDLARKDGEQLPPGTEETPDKTCDHPARKHAA